MSFLNPQADYHTLKQLLRASNDTTHVKNALSPNGTFKYIDRESTKFVQRKYGGYIKPANISFDRIRRPLNCFMVFSHLERKRVAEENPELHNADLSKILGKKWKGLSPAERQPYIDEAERIRLLHTEIYPDYKYQPRRKGQGKRTQKKTESSEPHTGIKHNDVKKDNDSNDKRKSKPTHDVLNAKVSHGNESEMKEKSPLDGKPSSEMKSISNFNHIDKHTYSTENQLDQQINPYEIKVGCDQYSYPIFKENSQQKVEDSRYSHVYNPSCQLLTPDLSPVSCYKEPHFNTPINSGMNGMQSFPPTPEISPTQINHDVFTFDQMGYSNEYYDVHALKSNHQQPTHGIYPNKEYLMNYDFNTHVNDTSHLQYNQNTCQPVYLRHNFYDFYSYPSEMNQNNNMMMAANFEHFIPSI